MICESIIYIYINFLESIVLILNEKSVVIMYIMKYYIYIVFLALIIFISLAIGLLNPVYEGYKSPITHEGEKYVVDGTYTQTGNEIRDVNNNVVQFSDIKSQKILAKEYISFVEDKVVGRVFSVKGYYRDDLPTSSFTYKDNDGIVIDNIIEDKRIANNPTITKDGTELEIVNSYYHVSFIKDTVVGRIFPVKWYYSSNDSDYNFDYGKNSEGDDYTPDEKKQVTPTIKKDSTELEIVNINLSDTDKNTLYVEDIKYAMNDNSGERFQLPKEPIVNRYSTSTDDADGDSQYKIVDGKIVKNNDWNADTAFPDYHDSASSLIQEDPRLKQKKMYVIGPDGKQIEVPWTGKQTDINYNEPGYFRYQPSTFIPNYEDSVYLSRLTGYSTTQPIEDTASKMGGFCEYHKYSPIKIEQECGKLEKNACASTSCCVLLGGSRCVGGNEKGPTMKANYSDITILNRDHYFYKGKCYGNCPH